MNEMPPSNHDVFVKRADSGYGSLHASNPKRSYSSRRSSTALSARPTSTSTATLAPATSSPMTKSPSAPSPTPASSSSSKRRMRCPRPQPRSRSCYLRSSRSHQTYRKPTPPSNHAASFFHSPSPALSDDATGTGTGLLRSTSLGVPLAPSHFHSHDSDADAESLKRELPQTTQYWTSNRTRRLEYAAIDAASRGVRGWVMRNLVPDCLVPKQNKQHVAFDDDTGSVRRYRLDLDQVDESAASMSGHASEKTRCSAPRKKSSILSWMRR
ncbi:hypothetical protein BROUX41_002935 [Berkeleyomyces rouxiae]|uniref:uncharacterized protein n=1 Tax=Berkeleyomyces rouxiae TaxID=2035830 RepID=UPI003B7AE472